MKILAVASSSERLDHLANALRSAYPGAVIECFSDPLMVIKYCLNSPADLILSELDLKRINGVELIDILHRKSPSLSAVLVLDGEKDGVRAAASEIGVIVKPVTGEKLRLTLRSDRAM